LIYDVYGLQGMMDGSLSASYELANNISASATSGWNSGAGYIPPAMGNAASPFTGNFNGEGIRSQFIY